jgi:hypothetical protein
MSLSFKDYLKNYDLFFAHLMGQEGDQEKNHAWAQLFFQPAGGPFLAEHSPPGSLPALLTAGASWGATGISCTKIVKDLKNLTGCTFASRDISQYKNVFLYSLCLLWDAEAPVDLQSDQLSVAMSFYELMTRSAPRHSVPSGAHKDKRRPMETSYSSGVDDILGAHSSDDDSEESRLPKNGNKPNNEGEVVTPLPFDDDRWPLSPLAAEVWRRSRSSRHKPLNPKEFLEDIPLFEGVPQWAPENNHRKDGLSRQDKELKDIQQKLLNIIKINAYVMLGLEENWDPSEVVSGEGCNMPSMHDASLASFHLVCDLEKKVENLRKSHSIQGSVEKDNQLFSKKDITTAKLTSQIRGFRAGGKGNSNSKGQSQFSGAAGGYQGRGKGQKGQGKGNRSSSSHSNRSGKGKGKP